MGEEKKSLAEEHPDDLEMLSIDVERAMERYQDALRKSAARGLSKEQNHGNP